MGERPSLSRRMHARDRDVRPSMMLVMMTTMIEDTNDTFQCTKPYFKHFTNTNSLNPPQNPMMTVFLLSPFYRRGN